MRDITSILIQDVLEGIINPHCQLIGKMLNKNEQITGFQMDSQVTDSNPDWAKRFVLWYSLVIFNTEEDSYFHKNVTKFYRSAL